MRNVLAALSYLPLVNLWLLTRADDDEFLSSHLSQGLLLLLVEGFVVMLYVPCKLVLGRSSLLSLVLCDLPAAAAFLLLIVMSLWGALGALSGQLVRLPLASFLLPSEGEARRL